MSDEQEQHAGEGEFSLDTFYGQASARIRQVMQNGEPWYSVIDVVGLLTDNPIPRNYWADMKRKIQDEGFRELLEKCKQLKMPAADGKERFTDCADRETITELARYVPATAPWRAKLKELPMSMLYVIGPRDGSMVKIGVSADVARRLQDHQRGSPVPLVILWQTPGGRELESWLHRAFAQRRAHGEWFHFRDTDAVIAIEAAVKERAA